MARQKTRTKENPDADEIKKLLAGLDLGQKSDQDKAKPIEPTDPVDVESLLEGIDLSDVSNVDVGEKPPESPINLNTKPETQVEDLAKPTQPQSILEEEPISTKKTQEEDTKKAVESPDTSEESPEPPPIFWSFIEEDNTDPEIILEDSDKSTQDLYEEEMPTKAPDTTTEAERRRQALINRLTKQFGPNVIEEIQAASEVLTEESMQNLLLQYFAEDQEFNAEQEIRLAQERSNKKSWSQKIAQSRAFGPIGSAILGTTLGIGGSIAARSGANILLKKVLSNVVHGGLGEVTAATTGGIFGGIKAYKAERERRRDARQLLKDLQEARDEGINSVSALQLINEALKDGLKGDESAMSEILFQQSCLRMGALSENQLYELAERGWERVRSGESAQDIILENLAEVLDQKANLDFSVSKKQFKANYGRDWQNMAKKVSIGAAVGGLTSLAAYEVAHWIADKIGDLWAHYHDTPEVTPQPLAPTSEPTHPSISETPTTKAPSIPESPHHITNPTDYARELTIKDPTFQDMVNKFAHGQVSGEDGANSILYQHGIDAIHPIQELNNATLTDCLKDFVQTNHDELSDQQMMRAVYHLTSHPTLLVDYQTGRLSAESLASNWHHLSEGLALNPAREVEIKENVKEFIEAQRKLWTGDHIPAAISPIGLSASSAAPSLPSEPSIISNPAATSSVSFWQSPIGNGLKAVAVMSGAAAVVGSGLYLVLNKLDQKRAGQSEQPGQKGDQETEEKKRATGEPERKVLQGELVVNNPVSIEEFVQFVEQDLESKLQDLSVNSVIMRLTTGSAGRNATIELSPDAQNIYLGNLDVPRHDTGNIGTINLGRSRKIWFPDGGSTPVYEVGNHIGIRDVNDPDRRPDFSKPGHFEFYYIK